MGARFRKSINLGGGVKVNLNAKSASISAGVPGARVTYNSKGQRTTSVGLPGTGVAYRTTKKVTTQSGHTVSSVAASGAGSPQAGHRGASLPKSRDEKKFTKVVAKSAKNPDALREWLTHPELGEAAGLMMGAAYCRWALGVAGGRFANALSVAPSPASEGFYARHPIEIQLEMAGATAKVGVNRAGASLLLAAIHNQSREFERALAALAEAEESDVRTAMEAMFLYNLERHEDVLHATRWVQSGVNSPFGGLALILRGCALRELGRPFEAQMAMDGAIHGIVSSRPLMDLCDFERAKTYAARPGGTTVARMTLQSLRARNPGYPGLEAALAALQDE